MRLDLQVDLVDDRAARDNFDRVQQKIEAASLLKFDCRFLKFGTVTGGRQEIAHGLGFNPQDVIITRQTGASDFELSYEEFTDTVIVSRGTGPYQFRCFVGTFAEDQYEDLDIRRS